MLVSGFLETSLQILYYQYAKDKAAPFVANYVDAQLGRFQNPNMDRILALTRSFSPDWATGLRAATEGEIKDSIDSIVANRHKIAHGESVGIRFHE